MIVILNMSKSSNTKSDKPEKKGMETKTNTTSTTKTNSNSTDMTKEKKDALKKVSQKQDNKSGGVAMTPLEPTENNESFEVGRAKRRGAGPQIDYASTVEDAYDNLNSILGGEGIQKLTGDTQNLMKQQMQLAKSMESMKPMIDSLGPMMDQAKGLMGSGSNNIADLAKNFTAGGKK